VPEWQQFLYCMIVFIVLIVLIVLIGAVLVLFIAWLMPNHAGITTFPLVL